MAEEGNVVQPTTEIPPTAVQPAPVATAAPAPTQAPVLEPGVKPDRLRSTVEFYKDKPEATETLAKELGLLTRDEFNRYQVNDAREKAILKHGLTPEDAGLLDGSTPEEVYRKAEYLAQRTAKPAPTEPTTATAPTAQPPAPATASIPPVHTEDFANRKLTPREAEEAYKRLSGHK